MTEIGLKTDLLSAAIMYFFCTYLRNLLNYPDNLPTDARAHELKPKWMVGSILIREEVQQ